VSNKDDGDIGRMAFECTNTACPLDGGTKVFSIDLGDDRALTGLRMRQRRAYFIGSLCLLRPVVCMFRAVLSVCFCTGHFVMVPLNLTRILLLEFCFL